MRSATAFGVLAALVGSAVSSPLNVRQSYGFLMTVAGGNDDVDGEVITANGKEFWLGKETKTSCPTGVDCGSFPNITTIDIGDDTIGMYAIVPGGQDIYFKPSGALSFTDPHEEGVFPTGSITKGFYDAHEGDSFRLFSDNSTTFYTCGDEFPFQIYGKLKGVKTACATPVEFGIVLTEATFIGAYQYE